MLNIFILVVLLSSVLCQDGQCDPAENEDQLQYFENDLDIKPIPEIEIDKAISVLSEDKRREVQEDASVADGLRSIENTNEPIIVNPFHVSFPQPLCDSRENNVSIGRTLYYSGGRCYVLRPWWSRTFTSISYVSCLRRSCRHIPCNTWLSSYRYWCSPTNYKSFNIWLFCPHTERVYHRLPLRLPQCCECQRHKVLTEFPLDFISKTQ